MNCTGKFQYLLQSVDDYNADNIYEAGNIIVANRTGPSLSGRQASQAKLLYYPTAGSTQSLSQQLLKLTAWNHFGAKRFQMLGIDLAIDQSHAF